jgi:NTP pyrophosphatase (non-canonical NTP hydrolase)
MPRKGARPSRRKTPAPAAGRRAAPEKPPLQPALPAPLTLPALQGYVREVVAARGYTRDLNEIFILAVEELGELAAEFKNATFYPDRFDPGNLAFEIVDVLLYLIDLANGFGIDLAAHWPAHERKNDARFAGRRGGRPPRARIKPGFDLARLAEHLERKRAERGFEDTPERLMILLTEEMGEIATEIRKHWKRLADPERVADEIIDALTYVIRMARGFGIAWSGPSPKRSAAMPAGRGCIRESALVPHHRHAARVP